MRDPNGMWRWLDERVRMAEGAVEIGLTDHGNVGVWLHGDRYEAPIGTGDTVADAMLDARTNALAKDGER